MTQRNLETFKQTVWEYYFAHQRNLPWRDIQFSTKQLGYRILVSEIMLQQTQVRRVVEKYNEWMVNFPTISDVANANLSEILTLWSGLGYNRRARFLHEACKQIVADYDGSVPTTAKELTGLAGIGTNTAGAIMAYTFNTPVIFIETNIRTVYIYHFFHHADTVADADLLPLLHDTVDLENPREWYWALMDYGTFLKKEVGNIARLSKHHTVQSKFEGSRRQLRGEVLRQLIAGEKSASNLQTATQNNSELADVLVALVAEGLVVHEGTSYRLPS